MTLERRLCSFVHSSEILLLLQVCEEQSCEEQVLPLAVNYMDRFLCVCRIKRQHLQLLGATCLLIASKLRSTNFLPIDLLCAYTDYSVTYDVVVVSVENVLIWSLNYLDHHLSARVVHFLHQVTARKWWHCFEDSSTTMFPFFKILGDFRGLCCSLIADTNNAFWGSWCDIIGVDKGGIRSRGADGHKNLQQTRIECTISFIHSGELTSRGQPKCFTKNWCRYQQYK